MGVQTFLPWDVPPHATCRPTTSLRTIHVLKLSSDILEKLSRESEIFGIEMSGRIFRGGIFPEIMCREMSWGCKFSEGIFGV